jgi:hypothetical protein
MVRRRIIFHHRAFLLFALPVILNCQAWTALHSHRSLSSHKMEESSSSNTITILGFGSLISENSSRLTFPDLHNFRLVRVPHYRRVFGHVASIFFQRNIARKETLEMASLSVEYVDHTYPGFLAAAFEVPADELMADGIPSQAFLEREEEFDVITVPYFPVDPVSQQVFAEESQQGVICQRGSDELYIQRWGEERFQEYYGQYGIQTIWNWTEGLRPCAVYLRHCYLAAEKLGCLDSFLDETYLVDRKTKLRDYMKQYPQILQELPPPEFAKRYSG